MAVPGMFGIQQNNNVLSADINMKNSIMLTLNSKAFKVFRSMNETSLAQLSRVDREELAVLSVCLQAACDVKAIADNAKLYHENYSSRNIGADPLSNIRIPSKKATKKKRGKRGGRNRGEDGDMDDPEEDEEEEDDGSPATSLVNRRFQNLCRSELRFTNRISVLIEFLPIRSHFNTLSATTGLITPTPTIQHAMVSHPGLQVSDVSMVRIMFVAVDHDAFEAFKICVLQILSSSSNTFRRPLVDLRTYLGCTPSKDKGQNPKAFVDLALEFRSALDFHRCLQRMGGSIAPRDRLGEESMMTKRYAPIANAESADDRADSSTFFRCVQPDSVIYNQSRMRETTPGDMFEEQFQPDFYNLNGSVSQSGEVCMRFFPGTCYILPVNMQAPHIFAGSTLAIPPLREITVADIRAFMLFACINVSQPDLATLLSEISEESPHILTAIFMLTFKAPQVLLERFQETYSVMKKMADRYSQAQHVLSHRVSIAMLKRGVTMSPSSIRSMFYHMFKGDLRAAGKAFPGIDVDDVPLFAWQATSMKNTLCNTPVYMRMCHELIDTSGYPSKVKMLVAPAASQVSRVDTIQAHYHKMMAQNELVLSDAERAKTRKRLVLAREIRLQYCSADSKNQAVPFQMEGIDDDDSSDFSDEEEVMRAQEKAKLAIMCLVPEGAYDDPELGLQRPESFFNSDNHGDEDATAAMRGRRSHMHRQAALRDRDDEDEEEEKEDDEDEDDGGAWGLSRRRGHARARVHSAIANVRPEKHREYDDDELDDTNVESLQVSGAFEAATSIICNRTGEMFPFPLFEEGSELLRSDNYKDGYLGHLAASVSKWLSAKPYDTALLRGLGVLANTYNSMSVDEMMDCVSRAQVAGVMYVSPTMPYMDILEKSHAQYAGVYDEIKRQALMFAAAQDKKRAISMYRYVIDNALKDLKQAYSNGSVHHTLASCLDVIETQYTTVNTMRQQLGDPTISFTDSRMMGRLGNTLPAYMDTDIFSAFIVASVREYEVTGGCRQDMTLVFVSLYYLCQVFDLSPGTVVPNILNQGEFGGGKSFVMALVRSMLMGFLVTNLSHESNLRVTGMDNTIAIRFCDDVAPDHFGIQANGEPSIKSALKKEMATNQYVGVSVLHLDKNTGARTNVTQYTRINEATMNNTNHNVTKILEPPLADRHWISTSGSEARRKDGKKGAADTDAMAKSPEWQRTARFHHILVSLLSILYTAIRSGLPTPCDFAAAPLIQRITKEIERRGITMSTRAVRRLYSTALSYSFLRSILILLSKQADFLSSAQVFDLPAFVEAAICMTIMTQNSVRQAAASFLPHMVDVVRLQFINVITHALDNKCIAFCVPTDPATGCPIAGYVELTLPQNSPFKSIVEYLTNIYETWYRRKGDFEALINNMYTQIVTDAVWEEADFPPELLAVVYQHIAGEDEDQEDGSAAAAHPSKEPTTLSKVPLELRHKYTAISQPLAAVYSMLAKGLIPEAHINAVFDHLSAAYTKDVPAARLGHSGSVGAGASTGGRASGGFSIASQAMPAFSGQPQLPPLPENVPHQWAVLTNPTMLIPQCADAPSAHPNAQRLPTSMLCSVSLFSNRQGGTKLVEEVLKASTSRHERPDPIVLPTGVEGAPQIPVTIRLESNRKAEKTYIQREYASSSEWLRRTMGKARDDDAEEDRADGYHVPEYEVDTEAADLRTTSNIDKLFAFFVQPDDFGKAIPIGCNAETFAYALQAISMGKEPWDSNGDPLPIVKLGGINFNVSNLHEVDKILAKKSFPGSEMVTVESMTTGRLAEASKQRKKASSSLLSMATKGFEQASDEGENSEDGDDDISEEKESEALRARARARARVSAPVQRQVPAEAQVPAQARASAQAPSQTQQRASFHSREQPSDTRIRERRNGSKRRHEPLLGDGGGNEYDEDGQENSVDRRTPPFSDGGHYQSEEPERSDDHGSPSIARHRKRHAHRHHTETLEAQPDRPFAFASNSNSGLRTRDQTLADVLSNMRPTRSSISGSSPDVSTSNARSSNTLRETSVSPLITDMSLCSTDSGAREREREREREAPVERGSSAHRTGRSARPSLATATAAATPSPLRGQSVSLRPECFNTDGL